uniref:G-protein coupled receptors family 1 profile domain-containing protein n=1 Tax=Seriola dumerili TaxID=41447 RepID=A0A3B4U954_SERDU
MDIKLSNVQYMWSTKLCYPQLLNSSCRGLLRPRSEAVLLYMLLSSITVLTVALNLLVIISISHFRQLYTPTNLLLLSLATSDLLVGLLVMPVETVRFVESCWLLGDLMCALSYIIGFTLISASVGNMVLISIDRYVAICYPLQYPNKITRSRVEVCVCLCWALTCYESCLLMHFESSYLQLIIYKITHCCVFHSNADKVSLLLVHQQCH